MRAGTLTFAFAVGSLLIAALGCSSAGFSTHPMDMPPTAGSADLFTIRVNRVDCPPTAAVGDTLRLRFRGIVGTDGCHEFAHFSTERDSYRIDIHVMGVVQPQMGCPEVMVMLGGRELEVYPLHEGDLTVVVHRPGEAALVDTVHVAGAGAGRARAFLQSLVDHPEDALDFVDEDDLVIARRLGISYPEAPGKALISRDLTEQSRDFLRRRGLDGQYTIEELDSGESRLVLFPDNNALTQSWVFRDGKLVSSILSRVGGWQQVDSPHFRFFISDTTLFHEENIAALETFLTETAALLGLTDADMDRLSQQKIYYCFCSSEDEIRELTGYAARGMYILSHDLIVSTYSAHFHELAHLLMNYRLREPHLYTHPLLLEGFAVTAGGRGGKSPAILHQLGLGLYRAGWMSPDELLDTGNFRQLNASVSYPGSAPYNRFLLEHLGVEGYLELYARYGGDASAVTAMKIRKSALPPDVAWQRFLDEQPRTGSVIPGVGGVRVGADTFAFRPLPGGKHFGFAVPGITLVQAGPPAVGYRSFLFEELLGDQPYAGERYLIRASAEEVGVYDLFTNTMIAHTAMTVSGDPEEVPHITGRYLFSVDRGVFPGDLGKIECRFPGD